MTGTVLVDFDGTISTEDVGNRLFQRITRGAWKEVVDSWKRGEVSSRLCLIHECSLARATRDEVLEFALEQPIDSGFPGFLRDVRSRGWKVRVVSDGLELYIRAILEREGLGDLPVEANLVHFAGDRLMPAFPYAGRGCGACGNCKRGAVEAARPGPVVLLGDGLSDRCAAVSADRVFAKNGRDLAAFCRTSGIPYRGFDDFAELRERWDQDAPRLLEQRR